MMDDHLSMVGCLEQPGAEQTKEGEAQTDKDVLDHHDHHDHHDYHDHDQNYDDHHDYHDYHDYHDHDQNYDDHHDNHYNRHFDHHDDHDFHNDDYLGPVVHEDDVPNVEQCVSTQDPNKRFGDPLPDDDDYYD